MTTLFISDLHLQPSRPALKSLFLSFLQQCAAEAERLYILGDLFETWIGDDGSLPDYADEIQALRRVSDSGVPLVFLPGNRDFLVGPAFAEAAGAEILNGINRISVNDIDTLILHGDELCTDDLSHQEFRKVALDPEVQARLLSLPLDQRRQMAEMLRSTSKAGNKPADIIDVNESAVESCFREHGLHRMIHGHTHRPAIHNLSVDGSPAQRFVLTDWHDDHGGYLLCEGDSWTLETWRPD